MLSDSKSNATGSGSLARRLRRGALWTLIGRSAGMAAVFLVQVVLARGLGAQPYAAYVVAWSCSTLFGMLGMFGLNTLGCRYLAESFAVHDRRRAARALMIMGTVVCVSVCGSALLGGIFFGTLAPAIFRMPELSNLAYAVAVWIALLAATQLLAELYRGLHNLLAASVLSGVSGGLLSNAIFLGLLIMASGHGALALSTVVQFAAVAMGIQFVVSSVGLVFSWRTASQAASGAPTKQLSNLSFSSVIRDASPVMAVQVGGFGIAQLDIWLVGIFGAPEQLAAYAVARRLALLVAIPLTQVGQVISSTISELHTRCEMEKLGQVLKGAATTAALISIPLALCLVVFGRALLTSVFGTEYLLGATALQLFCLGQIVFALTGPCGPTLLMTGHQRSVLCIMLASGTVFVHATWASALFGVNGMAAVVALFVALNNLLQWCVVRKRMGLSTSPSFDLGYLQSSL